MVVPTLSPSSIGMAMLISISPCTAIAIVSPIVAELDCTSIVTTAPARTPRTGWELKARKISFLPWRKLIELPICSMPRKSRPNPTSPLPMYFCFLVLPNTERNIPIPIIGRA
jgi:hypothetical protein